MARHTTARSASVLSPLTTLRRERGQVRVLLPLCFATERDEEKTKGTLTPGPSHGEAPGEGRQDAVALAPGWVIALLFLTPSVLHAAEQPLGDMPWFDWNRGWFAVILALVCGAVIVCTEMAKRGWSTYVRPIAGLSAIDDAVGRATEMGRPILFVPGIMDLDQIETVAGLTVLTHVGGKAAQYDAALEVPTARSLVMTAAREALQGAYLAAGRPESFNEERVYYVTDDQFGYVAHTCGWMAREKPAACFYLGKFFAESLLFAETGNSVGAIQLAGTAEPAQLPFFVAACDYTLIGEELFAASAYLSGEPQQLGTLKGQDFGKVLAGGLLLVGCLLATIAALSPRDSAAQHALTYFTQTVLGKGE